MPLSKVEKMDVFFKNVIPLFSQGQALRKQESRDIQNTGFRIPHFREDRQVRNDKYRRQRTLILQESFGGFGK